MVQTDHRLVVSKLNLRIQPVREPQGTKAPKRPDVSKLNKDSMRQAFINCICNHIGAMNLGSEDPEENMTCFFFSKCSSSLSCNYLRVSTSQNQDWFDENDEEIKRLFEEKHRLHKAHQDDTSSVFKKVAYSNICKKVQNRLSIKQDTWLSKKAEEIQLMIFFCFKFPVVLFGSHEHNTLYLLCPRLCFFIVLNHDLCISCNDSLTS